ncbi:MAG: PD40 domain-containing protein [Xanthomonadales bacterium]|nr:PD40 domain-containing protein [Xanthomonadales bacterium]
MTAAIRHILCAAFLAAEPGSAWAEPSAPAAPRGGFDYSVAPITSTFYGAVGTPTGTQDVTVVAAVGNAGPVVFTGCVFGGTHAGDFSFSPAPTDPLGVLPGATIGLPIRFTAGSLGPRSASLTCQTPNGTAVGGGFPVPLNGTGVANTLTTPPSLAFPDTPPGSTSAPSNVVATAGAGNSGNVTITSCSVSGAHAGDFAQTPPVLNHTLAPGASANIPLAFSPAALGPRTATLTCERTNGPPATFSVALSGTGSTSTAGAMTARVSVATGGAEGNDDSHAGKISEDGRFAVFTSSASNLVAGDTNASDDVFVHDRQTVETWRVSVSSSGANGFGPSFGGAISADGRYVAFLSSVDNLVPGDTNNVVDAFVRDRVSAQTQRVSVTSGGAQANGPSFCVGISADGREVAFSSSASNLVAGDANQANDVFVHDRQTGQTQRVSVTSSGGEALGHSYACALSADGRHVVFESEAFNLAPGQDTNGALDVFVRDRTTGQTRRVSVASDGSQANGAGFSPVLSADGRFVAFVSEASNLVPFDINAVADVFVHDRATGQTQRVSVATSGIQGNGASVEPSVSADGRFVAFVSDAWNLTPDDNNVADVFVRDRTSATTARIVPYGDAPFLSADGTRVAFQSAADHFVPGDTNAARDVFVHTFDAIYRSGFE